MLRIVAGDGQTTFQTFDDTAVRKRSLNRVLHGPLGRHLDELDRLQRDGAGVFVMINQGDGHGRTSKNVRAVRAVFVDLDGSPLEPVRKSTIQPHLITQTSPGRWHAFWMIEGCELSAFASIQSALAKKFAGDPSVKDLPRVMRLAGFWHLKSEPFLCRIVEEHVRRPYTVQDLVRGLDLELVSAERARQAGVRDAPIPEGARNDDLFALACRFHKCGLSRDGVLERLRTRNRERCRPPLDDREILAIVESAFRYEVTGFVGLTHAVMNSEAYLHASHSARSLYLEATRQYDGSNNGRISLTMSELKSRGFQNPKTLRRAIEECCALGLLDKTRPAQYRRQGERRLCALYGSRLWQKMA